MQVYYSQDIREEELKNRVATEWFRQFDCDSIVGNIDFCVCANLGAIRHVSPFERDKKTVPPFEGVGGVSRDAGGSPAITGNESVSLSKTHSVVHSAKTSRIATVQTPFVAGETPANPTTGDESVSLSKTHSVLQDWNAVSQAASGLYADTISMPPIVDNASERCKTDSQRLETLATTDGETPANQDSPYPLKEGDKGGGISYLPTVLPLSPSPSRTRCRKGSLPLLSQDLATARRRFS